MIFGILVDVPDIVDARTCSDILDRQHRGHHRVILIIIPVHAVFGQPCAASDSGLRVQRALLRHLRHNRRHRRIGLFLTHHRAADNVSGLQSPRMPISFLASSIRSASLDAHRLSFQSRNIQGQRRQLKGRAPFRATSCGNSVRGQPSLCCHGYRSSCRGTNRPT